MGERPALMRLICPDDTGYSPGRGRWLQFLDAEGDALALLGDKAQALVQPEAVQESIDVIEAHASRSPLSSHSI
jgi:hypothetical protein